MNTPIVLNPKIYCFSLFSAGYSCVHSLIRDLFDSPKNICPSFSEGDLLYVLSKKPPIKALHYKEQALSTLDHNINNKELETRVAFCNRHRDNIVPKKIYPKEALGKFCALSGLKPNKTSCEFLGPKQAKKFNIHNAFHIDGIFNIVDHNKFNQVLIEGVGSRKSYGYGLILVK